MRSSYGDFQGNFAKVSTQGITVYDKEFQERLRIKGLKFKSALYIDDSFLYCIQDNISSQPQMVMDGQDSI